MPGTHPKKRKTEVYSSEQLQSAINACNDGMSYREASATFGVPRSTISDKVNGKSEPILKRKGKEPKFDNGD